MVSFKMFAGTNVGLRENNEDNFTVCPDLRLNEWIVPAECGQAIPLGEKGCMMVVADGMGGQNAGEVASAIAVETVQDMFSPVKMSADVLKRPETIKGYLKRVIVEADTRVKAYSTTHANAEGMGSTIVMAWVVAGSVYVAWLGDSRAYSYVPGKGIGRLSKDHSYVQQLVDAGKLTDEEAMVHPNSNIITRSLGDIGQKPKVDVAEYSLVNGEVLLLCSDGLCGYCRDEVIGGIIEQYADNLQLCKEKLTDAALAAGGSDNITIALLRVFMDRKSVADGMHVSKNGIWRIKKYLTLRNAAVCGFGICLLAGLCFAGYSLFVPDKDENSPVSLKLRLDADSIRKGEDVRFHVEGNPACRFVYDESLIKINLNREDSTISLTKSLGEDSTIWIKAVSENDAEISDSRALILMKEELEHDLFDSIGYEQGSEESKGIDSAEIFDHKRDVEKGLSRKEDSISITTSGEPESATIQIVKKTAIKYNN